LTREGGSPTISAVFQRRATGGRAAMFHLILFVMFISCAFQLREVDFRRLKNEPNYRSSK
jgi:hypothetical protein